MDEPQQEILPALGAGTIGFGAAAVARKFCRDCGAPWDARWTLCQACAARQSQRAALQAQRAVLQLPRVLDLRTPATPYGVQSALILYFLLLGVCLVSMLIGRVGNSPANTSLLAGLVMSALVLAWSALEWEGSLAGLLRVPSPGWFALAIGISIFTFGIGAGVIHGVRVWIQMPPVKTSLDQAYSGYGWGVIILAVAVQPAVIEELAFRGIILGSLQRTLKASEAIIVSAMMFMVLHLSPIRFPHTLALGLAAGIIRIRCKSILPCMVLHFCHNFFCLVLESAGG